MAEIIFNPQKIVVKQNSAVLICGAQNSGKSTFTNSHFEKSMIVCSDDIFLSVVRKNFRNVYATDESVCQEAEFILNENISNLSGKIAVLDQISPILSSRLSAINIIRKSFDNIILVVFAIDVTQLLSRPQKANTPEKLKFNFFTPPKEAVVLTALNIVEQISSGNIGIGTNQTYIFTSNAYSTKCKVHF